MFKAAAGLAACAALYLTAIYAFVWSGNRRIAWASSRGVVLGPKPSFPSAREIWSRHSVSMTVTYGTLFLAMTLAGFSLWQRVGFAALAGLVFASFWISNSQDRIALDVASPARRTASIVGYWCLSVADWFGYMGVLCFGAALLVELF